MQGDYLRNNARIFPPCCNLYLVYMGYILTEYCNTTFYKNHCIDVTSNGLQAFFSKHSTDAANNGDIKTSNRHFLILKQGSTLCTLPYNTSTRRGYLDPCVYYIRQGQRLHTYIRQKFLYEELHLLRGRVSIGGLEFLPQFLRSCDL